MPSEPSVTGRSIAREICSCSESLAFKLLNGFFKSSDDLGYVLFSHSVYELHSRLQDGLAPSYRLRYICLSLDIKLKLYHSQFLVARLRLQVISYTVYLDADLPCDASYPYVCNRAEF